MIAAVAFAAGAASVVSLFLILVYRHANRWRR